MMDSGGSQRSPRVAAEGSGFERLRRPAASCTGRWRFQQAKLSTFGSKRRNSRSVVAVIAMPQHTDSAGFCTNCPTDTGYFHLCILCFRVSSSSWCQGMLDEPAAVVPSSTNSLGQLQPQRKPSLVCEGGSEATWKSVRCCTRPPARLERAATLGSSAEKCLRPQPLTNAGKGRRERETDGHGC